MKTSISSVAKAVEKAASIFGSQKALAERLDVSHQAVWAWINRNSIPAEHCTAIEIATSGAVTRRDLRPNDWHLIWPELAESQAGTATQEAVV